MGSTDPIVALLPILGAIAAAVTTRRHPVVAFGILFLTASLSRATLETPIGTMRPEMPAIAVVVLILITGGGARGLFSVPRPLRPMGLAFLGYLATIALSSAVVAPDRKQSLLMVAWLAISMIAGFVAFTLLRRQPRASLAPIAWTGAVMAALGIGAGVVFLVAGPAVAPGIQDAETVMPRVYALAWETNLYASFLALCVFPGIELARRSPGWISYAALGLMGIGFPLGITRGAYLALLAGLAGLVLVWAAGDRTRLRRLGATSAVTVAALVVGLACTIVLLPGAGNRLEDRETAVVATPTPTVRATESTGTPPPQGPTPDSSGEPTRTPEPTPDPTPTLDPTPTPEPPPEPMPDTVGFRLERVEIALAEIPQSPLIGFGAEAFGQRHPDRYAGSGPDHIAIMAVVVPYESGLVGAVALALGFLLLFRLLWHRGRAAAAARDWVGLGMAAAFIGSLVAMLVAYQVTNAIHLAVNWLIIGAAAAFCAEDASGLGVTGGETSAQRHG